MYNLGKLVLLHPAVKQMKYSCRLRCRSVLGEGRGGDGGRQHPPHSPAGHGALPAAAGRGLVCAEKSLQTPLMVFVSAFVAGILICRDRSWPDICRGLMVSIWQIADAVSVPYCTAAIAFRAASLGSRNAGRLLEGSYSLCRCCL